MITRHRIVGTAGHIDHGKTALVKALTGVDTDRLKEEQRRGITIELGFAKLELDELAIGVVDVPGHDRFIKSMVAGAGGIDVVLLVVAADEGVMAQTREHLAICSLLQVPLGLVALTKSDLVDGELVQLVQEEVRELCQGTLLANAPIIPCSAVTMEGIETLKQTLARLCRQSPERRIADVMRLPLDRVFSIKGFGTVVTGTLLSGEVAVGDEVLVLPEGLSSKVRTLQVHGENVERAVAGQRTAVNLASLDRRVVERGEVLTHPHGLLTSSMIVAEVELLASAARPLPRRSKLLFHLGTRQQAAVCVLLDQSEVRPGERALAQLSFEEPVVARVDHRFVIRGFAKQKGHGTTVGGGRVVRVRAPRIRGRHAQQIELCRAMASAKGAERVALEVLASGHAGIQPTELAARLSLSKAELAAALTTLTDGAAPCISRVDGELLVHHEVRQALAARVLGAVTAAQDERSHDAAVAEEELRSKLLAVGASARLLPLLLADLAAQQQIVRQHGRVALANRPRPSTDARLLTLGTRIEAHLLGAGLAPPREQELPALVQSSPPELATAVALLIAEARVVRVGPFLFAKSAVDELQTRVVAFLQAHGELDAADLKVLSGQSRKYAIPLAEHFDAQRVTLRIGEKRRLRRPS